MLRHKAADVVGARLFNGDRSFILLAMHLHINGEEKQFPESLTVSDLIDRLGAKGDRVAVELNLNILPRADWSSTSLKDGDKLEIVHFVGGGSR